MGLAIRNIRGVDTRSRYNRLLGAEALPRTCLTGEYDLTRSDPRQH